MRENWKIKSLGDVSLVGAGNSAPQDKSLFINGKYPFFRTSDVGKIKKGDLFVASDCLNEIGINKLKLHPEGTILIPKSGASTFLNHRVVMAVSGYVSSHLATIYPNSEILNVGFAFYFLIGIKAQNIIQDHAYPSLKLSDIKKIQIPIPPLQEQQQIAIILDKAFKAIDQAKANIEKNIKNAQELFQTTVDMAMSGEITKTWRIENQVVISVKEQLSKLQSKKNLLVSEKTIKREKPLPPLTEPETPYAIPKSWEWVRLGEIGDAINYPFVDGPFGSSINTKKDYIEEGVPVLRMMNVKPHRFINTLFKFVREDKYQQFTRHTVLPGDVLFSKVGAGVGEACIVPDDFLYGMLATTGITRMRVGQVASNRYLCSFLNANIKSFMRLASKAAQPFLNMTQIRMFPTPLPPLDEQSRIVDILENMMSETEHFEAIYQAKLASLNELKKSILQKAFAGELTNKTVEV